MNEKRIRKLVRMTKVDWLKYEQNWTVDSTQLGPMVNGFVDGALMRTIDDGFFGNGGPLSWSYKRTQFTDRFIVGAIKECLNFYWRNRFILEALYEKGYTEWKAGLDFWDSRNGTENEGFLERGWDDEWDVLHKSAKGYGPMEVWPTLSGQVDGGVPNYVYNRTTGQCEYVSQRPVIDTGEIL